MNPNRRTQIVGIIAISVLMACLAGCPAGDKWQQAANASDNLIKTVDGAQDLEISLYHEQLPKITPDEHIRVQQAFKKIGQLDKDLNKAILSGSASNSEAAYNAALAGLDEALANGTFQVSNPTANLTIKTSIDSIRFGLTAIHDIATAK